MLRQIAPKFGRIWNGRQQSKSSIDLSKRSFMNVSIHTVPLHRFSMFSWQQAAGMYPDLGSYLSLCARNNLSAKILIDPIHRR